MAEAFDLLNEANIFFLSCIIAHQSYDFQTDNRVSGPLPIFWLCLFVLGVVKEVCKYW